MFRNRSQCCQTKRPRADSRCWCWRVLYSAAVTLRQSL